MQLCIFPKIAGDVLERCGEQKQKIQKIIE